MKLFLLLTCGAGLLAGCSYTLVPHTPYLPVIRDRGQAEARLSTGLNGSELQVGYQVTEKLILHTALLNYRNGPAANGKGFRSADLGLGYYYNSPNGFWRLGGHAGAAYGSGTSTGGGCFECAGAPTPRVDYRVGYTYGYVQPTVLLVDNEVTWGFGLRVGRAYYHRLLQVGADSLGGPIQTTSFAGRQSAFVQPTVQYSRQLLHWLTLSTTLGTQTFLERSKPIGSMNQFIGQVGLHLVLHTRQAPRP